MARLDGIRDNIIGLQTNAENIQEQSNNYERGNSATHIYQAAMQGQIALCRCMLD